MKVEEMLPKLIRAGLENDSKSFEVISMTISNRLKSKNPTISKEINQILFNKNVGKDTYRSIGLDRLPINKKNNMNLVSIKEIDALDEPILNFAIKEKYERFIQEQYKAEELLKIGVKPSNSILIYGEPGVGKTYSAKWFAYKLNKPLMVLDLSSIISSYLGETGANIKKVLDYAKGNDAILLLDEFDAIAKKRDDERELGEIKRIVNVLLKELEEWPIGNLVIAATNHPELLDKAMWRRFDLKINIKLPDKNLRKKIIEREFKKCNNIPRDLILLLAETTKDINSAEIVRMCNEIKKEYVLSSSNDLEFAIIDKIGYNSSKLNSCQKTELVLRLNKNKGLPADKISELTGIPKSSVYRYLKK